MKCAIMQPTYIPWIGYFDLIDQVDKFVFLDNVQLSRSSWHVRNRIKTAHGELYLTVPVRRIKDKNQTMLCDAVINYRQPWVRKHLKSIEQAYKKTPHADEVYLFLEAAIKTEEMSLSELNIGLIKKISSRLGINKEFIKASGLKNIIGRKDTLVVSVCKQIGCDCYISPPGAHVYIEKDTPGGEFPKNGISLYYQDYEHPVYNQPYGGFLPNMSIVDLLFNRGFDGSLRIIRAGRKEPIDYLVFRRISHD